MNKLEQLEQTLDKCLKQLEELRKPKADFWEPTDGEEAWYIQTNGERIVIRANHCNKLGLAYKTEKDCQYTIDLAKAKQTLKREIYRLNDNSFPEWDWSDINKKYYFILNDSRLDIGSSLFSKVQPNWIYLKREVDAQYLLDNFEDELMLVLSE